MPTTKERNITKEIPYISVPLVPKIKIEPKNDVTTRMVVHFSDQKDDTLLYRRGDAEISHYKASRKSGKYCKSLRGRRLKGKGKGVSGARETGGVRKGGGRETPARRPLFFSFLTGEC